MELTKLLDNYTYIDSYQILELREDVDFLLKLKVLFVDKTVLFTKEYINESYRKYSFQWQKSDNTLIIRWDNAPHHPQIATHPHHKHVESQENIFDSSDILLEEVLTYIFENIIIPA